MNVQLETNSIKLVKKQTKNVYQVGKLDIYISLFIHDLSIIVKVWRVIGIYLVHHATNNSSGHIVDTQKTS